MDDNNDKRGLLSTLSKEGLKVAWKLLPPPVKIGIIAGIGGVLLFIMIIGLIISLNPINFLNYSDDVKISTDLEKTYEDDWTYLCKGDGCTAAEQTKINSIINSQKRFYDELEKIVENNKLTKRQRYLILTTIFYNYDIEDFTEIDSDSGAYKLDGNDRIIDEEGSYGNAYSEEYDTIKELTKQFITYPIYCVNGDSEEEIKKSDGTTFSFGFFQRASIFIGGDGWDKEFGTVKKNCEDNGGRIEIKKDYSSSSSEDAFYEYLRSSTYIDSRSQFDSEFETYANANNLNIEDKKNWTEEDKLAVKNQIIDDIKDIVDDYEKYSETNDSSSLATISDDTEYWWPIGSDETTEANGVLFASGEPALKRVSSPFGWRIVWGKRKFHYGVDVGAGGQHGASNTNIIATKSGTVIFVHDGCRDHTDSRQDSCGGHRGNNVLIDHGNGVFSRVQHMAYNSIKVKVGDVVSQGQVLGKMGQSGDCTARHLHVEFYLNGTKYRDNNVNPLDYIDPNNPRPVSIGSSNGKLASMLTAMEGATKDSTGKNYYVYCQPNDPPTTAHGITLTSHYADFEKFGYKLTTSNNYRNYCRTTIPVDVVEKVYSYILEEKYMKPVIAAVEDLNLSQNQIDALTSLKYNHGNISGFREAYNKYGSTEQLCTNWWHTYHINAGTIYERGLRNRRKYECNLFVNGVYYGVE